jgi:predicted Zn-dependent protease
MVTFLIALLVISTFSSVATVFAAPSYSIELEEFRWNRFPLRVLVDMNQWSRLDYSVAVHEALDTWIASIENYTESFGGTTLNFVDFKFHLGNSNSTNNPHVFITFAQDEIPPASNIVGLTTYRWESYTHEPVPPIVINITTYSKTASPQFVKNVAMHELGHALGLGHAASPSTSNGPELMYKSSARDQTIYPSTLDAYGLTRLYSGDFDQTVHLPSSITYKMLLDGDSRPSIVAFWETYSRYLVLIAAFAILLIVVLALWRAKKQTDLEEAAWQGTPGNMPPPPPPPSNTGKRAV